MGRGRGLCGANTIHERRPLSSPVSCLRFLWGVLKCLQGNVCHDFKTTHRRLETAILSGTSNRYMMVDPYVKKTRYPARDNSATCLVPMSKKKQSPRVVVCCNLDIRNMGHEHVPHHRPGTRPTAWAANTSHHIGFEHVLPYGFRTRSGSRTRPTA